MPERQRVEKRRRIAYRNCFLLGGIFLLGLCLRLYRLDAQSIWFDEMNTLVQDPQASLSAYLSDVQVVNPDHLPLFFVILYGWTRLVGEDPVALRLLSVALGSLCIPLIYLLGRQVLRPKAGLVAALCLALSPIHIYMHQAIRYHAFLDFLVLLSLLLTLRAAASRRPGWLVLHAVVCGCAVFTHLTAALPVLLEYGYLIYCSAPKHAPAAPLRTRLAAYLSPRTTALGLLLALVAVHCLVWFRSVQRPEVTWYTLPSLGQWLNDLCGDVVVSLNVDLLNTPLVFSLMGPARQTSARIAEDIASLLFFGGALAWGVARAFKLRHERDPRARGFKFTVGLVFAPILLLTFLSVAWQPVVLPRYTMFSSFAVFVIVGGLVTGLPGRFARAAALVALAGMFAMQLNLLLPNLARTDFVGVRKQLQRAGAAGENIVALYMTPDGRMPVPSTRRILKRNLGDFKMHVILAYSLAGAVTQNMECLASNVDSRNSHRRAWLLIEHWTGFPEQAALEETLYASGVAFKHWQSTNLHLYEMRLPRADDEVYLPAIPLDDLGPDREDVVAAMTGLDADDIGDPEVIQALEWAVPRVPIAEMEWPLFFESLRAMQVCPKSGRLIGKHVLNTDNDAQFNLLLNGLSYLAENNPQRANAYFSQLDSEFIFYVDDLAPGFSEIVDEDYASARAKAVDVSTRFPSRVPAFFRCLLGISPVPCDSSLVPLL